LFGGSLLFGFLVGIIKVTPFKKRVTFISSGGTIKILFPIGNE
jgi:hypothetical protein